MGHVSAHIDSHLTSCYASLYRASGEPTLVIDVCQSAARMRRNYGDAAAHHSMQHAGPHTYMPTSATGTPTRARHHKYNHAPGGVVRARVENDSLAGSAGHGCRAARAGQPKTYRPERTGEGEPEPEGGRAALDCGYNLSIRTCKKKATHTHIYLNEHNHKNVQTLAHMQICKHVHFNKYEHKTTYALT